jgi:hypothetical protein
MLACQVIVDGVTNNPSSTSRLAGGSRPWCALYVSGVDNFQRAARALIYQEALVGRGRAQALDPQEL